MDVAPELAGGNPSNSGGALRQRGQAEVEAPDAVQRVEHPDKPEKPEERPGFFPGPNHRTHESERIGRMSERCRLFLLSKYWKCITFVVIGFTPVVGLSVALPTLLQEGAGVLGIHELAHWLLAVWLAAQFLFNFAAAQHTDPGGCSKIKPTHGLTGQFEMVLQESDAEATVRKDVVQALKYAPAWCNHCKHWKPPRAHHCSFCKRCVMRMDHHCPFTGNCIGFRNHGHFILMYLFAILGLSYAVLLLLLHLYHGFQHPNHAPFFTSFLKHYRFLTGPSGFIVSIVSKLVAMTSPGVAIFSVAAVVAFAAVLGFGTPAIWLAATNQTTLETHFPMKEYVQIKPQVYCPLGPGFYHRGWRQNMKDLLGPRWWLRLLLPIKGEPDLFVALAPRPSTVGAEALLMRVNQVESDGVQQEVSSVTQLGINPGPADRVVQNSV